MIYTHYEIYKATERRGEKTLVGTRKDWNAGEKLAAKISKTGYAFARFVNAQGQHSDMWFVEVAK